MVLARTIFPSHTHLHPNQIYGWYGLIIYNWVVSSLKPAQGCSPMHWLLPQAPQLTDARRGQVWSACPWPGTEKSSAQDPIWVAAKICQVYFCFKRMFSPQCFSPRKLAARFAHIPGKQNFGEGTAKSSPLWDRMRLKGLGPGPHRTLLPWNTGRSKPQTRGFRFSKPALEPQKRSNVRLEPLKGANQKNTVIKLWYMSGMDMDVSFLRLDNHTNQQQLSGSHAYITRGSVNHDCSSLPTTHSPDFGWIGMDFGRAMSQNSWLCRTGSTAQENNHPQRSTRSPQWPITWKLRLWPKVMSMLSLLFPGELSVMGFNGRQLLWKVTESNAAIWMGGHSRMLKPANCWALAGGPLACQQIPGHPRTNDCTVPSPVPVVGSKKRKIAFKHAKLNMFHLSIL